MAISYFKKFNTGTPILGSTNDQANPTVDNAMNDWMKSEFDLTSPMPLITDQTKIFSGEGRNGFIVKLDRSKPRANANGKWVIRDERRTAIGGGITTTNRFFLRMAIYLPSDNFEFPNDNREYIVFYQHNVNATNPRLYLRVTHNGQFYVQLEENTESITYRHYLGPATLDTLHTFVIEANWGTDNNGYVNVWKDTPSDFAPLYNSSGNLTINSGVSGKFTFLKRESEDFSRFNRVGRNVSDGYTLVYNFTQFGAYVPNPSLPWNSTNPFSGEEPYDPNNLTTLPTYREFYVSGVAWLIPEPEWNRQDIVNFMFEVDPTIPPDPTEGFRARLRFPNNSIV
jgi:hypothetical protein